MSVANILTISRIVFTPIIIYLLFSETFTSYLWALVLFIVASITDYLDGKVARSFEAPSRLGTFLDPLADKVLVIGTFFGLGLLIPHIVPWWAVVLILARDLFITALRLWHESNKRSLRTFFIAKAKTSVQLTFLIGILLLLTGSKSTGAIRDVSMDVLSSSLPWILMIFVVSFTVWTGLVYVFSRNAVTPAS